MSKASRSARNVNPTREVTGSIFSIAALLSALVATASLASPLSHGQIDRGTVAAGASTAQPDGPGAGSLDSLAVDPANPNVLYAGTAHAGAYKSTDAGANWLPINSGFDANTRGFSMVLVIDPSSPSTLYAAFPGLYKTTDGGANWVTVSSASLKSNYIYSLAVDSRGTIYAGIGYSGLIKSSDGGASWSDITSGLNPEYIKILAVDSSTPGSVYVEAGDGLYRTSNAGASWSKIFGGYFGSLAIDPSDSNILYVADVSSTFGRVFKTTDGGKTWITGGSGVMGARPTGLAIDPDNPTNIYAGTDRGLFKSVDGGISWAEVGQGLPAASVNPIIDRSSPGVIYAAGVGLFKSTDGGAGWSELNRGLPAAAVRAVAYSPFASGMLYAGTDDGRIYLTSDGTNWSLVVPASENNPVTSILVDSSSPNIVYASMAEGILKSTDGGNRWSAFGPFDYDATLVIAASNSRVLYVNVGDGVYRTRDGGINWSQTDSIPSFRKANNVEINALAVDPSNADTLYAGVRAYINDNLVGGIFKSTDGGNNWFTANASPGNTFRDLVISAANPQQIYARLYFGGLIRSTNGGMTWKDVSLPVAGFVAALAIDQSGAVYAAAGARIFRSANGGKRWSDMGLELFDPTVNAIAAKTSNPRMVYVATNVGVVQIAQ